MELTAADREHMEDVLIDQRVKRLVTEDNARGYQESQERFTYCLELLHISASHYLAEGMVNALEDYLEPKAYNLEGGKV
jgi:hypothetical protein